MDYSNVLQAVQAMNQGSDHQVRADNYRMVDQLNREGVSIKDLLGQIDDLKRKVDGLERPQRTMNEDLFLVMESAVRENDAVMTARKRLAEEKTRVVMTLCMQDNGYREAYDAYRDTVNREYVASRGDGPPTGLRDVE